MRVLEAADFEAQMVATDRFSYEPQTAESIRQDLVAMNVVRVPSDMYIAAPDGLDNYANFRMVTDSPRKTTEDMIKIEFAFHRAWWTGFSPLFSLYETEYPTDPFDTSQSQTLVMYDEGSNSATPIYNFDEPLETEGVDALEGTREWFQEFTGGLLPYFLSRVVMHTHLGTIKPIYSAEHRNVLGLFDCNIPGGTVSLAHFNELTPDTNVERYPDLREIGHSHQAIVATHEFAHALAYGLGAQEVFDKMTKWEKSWRNFAGRKPKKGMAISQRALDAPGSPPTLYGYTNHCEDFAESMVYYRFAPEKLDDTRRRAFDTMTSVYKETSQPSADYRSHTIKTDQPIYPHANIPEHLTATVRSWAEVTGQQRLMDDYSLVVGMLSASQAAEDIASHIGKIIGKI